MTEPSPSAPDLGPAASNAERPSVKTPPILFQRTQAAIAEIEAALGGRLLTYWTSSSGSVCGDDVVALYSILKTIGRTPKLFWFVKSSGGTASASLRMVHLIRQFTDDLTVLAPLECQSAATMLALGADRIEMGPLAHLSPVDTSLIHDLSPIDRDNDRVRVSPDELARVLRLWRDSDATGSGNPYAEVYKYVHPLVVGAVNRASALSTRLSVEILSYHVAERARAEAIAEHLNADYPSHSYPITWREAAAIGLSVKPMSDALNAQLLALNELYSEMGQKATTDFDEKNAHDSSILNIHECRNQLVFFQNDKDWYYRNDERRWITLNNNSSWRRVDWKDGAPSISIVHI